MDAIIWSVVVLSGLGIILGLGLGIASKKLAIQTDERVSQIREYLPGANCGGCGFPGCDGLAAALAKGQAAPGACSACSKENLDKIGTILGVAVEVGPKKVAKVLCNGGSGNCRDKAAYDGEMDCKAAALVAGGFKSCSVACLGLGTCAKVCPFGAIKIGEDKLAYVDEEVCTGCGRCAEECPQHVIAILPESTAAYVACRNRNLGKAVVNVCTVGCIGCKLCEKVCPEQAITMEQNLPVIDYEKCTGCGLCAAKCRPGCIISTVKTQEEAV